MATHKAIKDLVQILKLKNSCFVVKLFTLVCAGVKEQIKLFYQDKIPYSTKSTCNQT